MMDKDQILKILAEYGEKGLEHLSRPGAALRSGAEALQNQDNPIPAIKEGFSTPSEAPSGADLVDNMNIPDDQVLLKTALATANDLADPIDALGLGAIGKGGKALKAAAKAKYNPLGLEEVAGAKFKAALDAAKDVNPNIKPFVADYPANELDKFKNLLSPDGKSGVAVKPDGDMINVFSSEKGRGSDLVDRAILKGAKKADNFDQPNLNKLYESKGLKETDRMKFADEYAPDGWNYEKLGRPDVIMREMPAEGKIEALKRLIKGNL